MIDTLITNGFFEALIASCCGCTLSYIIKLKNNEKPKLVYYLLDIIASLIIAYYSFWEMTEGLNMSLINATLTCVILGSLGTKLIEFICEYFMSHFDSIINIILRKK